MGHCAPERSSETNVRKPQTTKVEMEMMRERSAETALLTVTCASVGAPHLRGVVGDKAEGVEAGAAEARAVERDEDVAVVRDELDGLLEAEHVALDALEHDAQDDVGLLQVLRVVVERREQPAQQRAECDDECACRKGEEVGTAAGPSASGQTHGRGAEATEGPPGRG
eukprot:5387877-Prymnesium_polylepis.1